MKKVSSKGKIYAIYDHIGNLKEETVWYSRDDDFLQAAKMGYDKDKEFKTHIHIPRPREIPKTQEAIVVVSGCLEASIYDYDKELISRFLLYNGSIGVFFHGFHGYRVMCDNTIFYEIKHGQFVGVKEDKVFYDTAD